MKPLDLLMIIRDGKTLNWAELVKQTEFEDCTDIDELRFALEQLSAAGLITFTERDHDDISEIKVTDTWTNIQATLGISLKEISRLEKGAMIVSPYLGQPEQNVPCPEVFVLMPFDPALKPVYQDHILSVAKSLGVTAGRADDFFSTRSVMSDIWQGICGARAIIADCTGRNANVFYEIGLAHVLGKRTVLISQNSEDIPFDLKYLRYIEYEFTPRGMKLFEQNLHGTLLYALGGEGGESTPPIREQQKSLQNQVQRVQAEKAREKARERSIEEGRRKIADENLTCPHCKKSKNIRVVGGPTFICNECGRSFE